VGNDQRGRLGFGNNVGDGEGFAAAGDPEQSLLGLAFFETGHQLVYCLGLVAGRFKVGFESKWHKPLIIPHSPFVLVVYNEGTMKQAIIFLNGDLADASGVKQEIKKTDLVIAADGGSKLAQKLGITPDLVVGDLDSYTGSKKIKTIPYPKDKDFTDSELAIDYALKQKVKRLVIVGLLGRRFDHLASNLMLAATLAAKGIKVEAVEGKQRLYFLSSRINLEGNPGDIVSLTPLKSNVKVTTRGLKWKLQGSTLKFGYGRGVSNVMTAKKVSLSVRRGILLVVHSRQ